MAEACPPAARRGLVLVVVTNQPDVARGRQSAQRRGGHQSVLRAAGRPSTPSTCAPTTTADGCACRKPEARHAPRRRPGPQPRPLARALWSGTGGATSPLVRGPVAAPCILTRLSGTRGRRRPTTWWAPGRGARVDPDSWIGRRGGACPMQLPYGIKIFADGADLEAILELSRNPTHLGLHDQPDVDAEGRASRTIRASPARSSRHVTDRPISFEVLCDDFDEMRAQAHRIALVGPQRLRQDPRHQHARRERRLAHRGAVGRWTAPQRDRPLVARPGAHRRRRRSPDSPVRWCRCSRAASPTPAATPCPS